ncbi:hypothetical protein AARAC_003248 [Aspergillus arachidicola]|uniref:Helicase C-terminal domain-containing protein n=1 Tax=Aspergillus arachidicola TaxID=656916 RepID=A0A2G7FJU1_9EURO|nr:hypothetical protein AARAC_003248 [Aspergillus arachidicola]
MTDEEDEEYDTYWANNSRVMTLDRLEPGNPKYRWNMEKLRKLGMGSSWLDFIALEKTVTAKSIPKALNALRRNILIPKFLSALRTQEAVSDTKAVKGLYRARHVEAVKSESDSSLVDAANLAGVMRESPKMRTMLGVLPDQVLLRNEKAMVWTFFPGEELYVCAVLKEARIDAVMLHAGLEHKERDEIVRTFNGPGDKVMVLVMSYLVNSASLNLQRYCHHVHLFSVATTKTTADQAMRSIYHWRTTIIYKNIYRRLNSFSFVVSAHV